MCGDPPGADDNASGVAGLLETARLIGNNEPNIDYQIDFVAYCLEEPPFFDTKFMGSYVHAKSLYKTKVDLIGMICYEMIGYFSDEPNSQKFPQPEFASMFPGTANFIIVVGIDKYIGFNQRVHSLMSEHGQIDVQGISLPSTHSLAGLSDHMNYWHFGYPALMINNTSFMRNPNYHMVTDTIHTLDFEKMTEVVNCTYHAIVHLQRQD